jgi:hypothetical protein
VFAVLGIGTAVAGLFFGDQEGGTSEPPPNRLPAGVNVYDVDGDDRAEFASINGDVMAIESPSQDAWWVPFVPFFGVVLAAAISAAAVISTSPRRQAEVERRLAALEAAQRPPPAV